MGWGSPDKEMIEVHIQLQYNTLMASFSGSDKTRENGIGHQHAQNAKNSEKSIENCCINVIHAARATYLQQKPKSKTIFTFLRSVVTRHSRVKTKYSLKSKSLLLFTSARAVKPRRSMDGKYGVGGSRVVHFLIIFYESQISNLLSSSSLHCLSQSRVTRQVDYQLLLTSN